MIGVLRARHVVRHPWVVISNFGLWVFIRCLGSGILGTKQTFLEIIST